MIGKKADVEYCTVDFIKLDLVSPVYKTLAYVAGIQKGRECVRSAKNGQGDIFLFSLLPRTRAPKFPFPSCLNTCHAGYQVIYILFCTI